MALIFGVYDRMRFYVDDTPVDCTVVNNDVSVSVEGQTFHLSDAQRIKIMPGVYLSLGKPNLEAQQKFAEKQRRIIDKIGEKIPLSYSEKAFPGKLLPRVAIEAPDHVKILRRKLYEERQRNRVPTPSLGYQ